MNGLLAANRCGVPVTIVLLNNGGGGIFHRLPVSQFGPHFSDYFITPHGLDFAHSAALYGLDYVRADDRESFRSAFSRAVGGRGSTLIEVRTDAIADLQAPRPNYGQSQTRHKQTLRMSNLKESGKLRRHSHFANPIKKLGALGVLGGKRNVPFVPFVVK